MPIDGTRILDLDGSFDAQWRLRAGNDTEVVDLREMGGHLRYMATHSRMRRFRRQLKPAMRHRLTFYGSGDYHHLSSAMVAQWRTPLSVVVFDNHPDWDVTTPWPCCGSWVNSILSMPHVAKVIVIGPGRPDLHGLHLLRGNAGALRSGKLEVYPATWDHSATLSAGGLSIPGCRTSRRGAVTTLFWRTVAELGWGNLMKRVVERLPTQQIYISVDKDCLIGEEAITNWEEGELRLADVAAAIELLGGEKEIVGADVTGEYSVGVIANPLFRLIGRFDHTVRAAPSQLDLERNEQANLILLAAFRVARG